MQRVVQFEVSDFTGAAGWAFLSVKGEKTHTRSPRTVVMLNPISADGRSTCENKGDDSSRYHRCARNQHGYEQRVYL